MHHYSTKNPPRHTPFLAYVAILTEYAWYPCKWDAQQKLYVDSVMGKDIGTDYYWVLELPDPKRLIAATKLIAQLTEVVESAQLQVLLEEILIYK